MQLNDDDKYSSYLPNFTSVLDTILANQAEFMKNGLFVQSMNGKSYSSTALEIWTESTMNKGSKLESSRLVILNNETHLL